MASSNMKLLIGLGNPGLEYKNTRHNLGFYILDFLAKKLDLEFKKEKFKGSYTVSNHLNQQIIFLKPLTYMNNSGECVRNFANYFNIPSNNILVIYDDLALPLASMRYRSQGSSGGHNGVKSIIECLKTQNFKRLKVGIGSNPNFLWKEWVLQKFSTIEQQEIKKILPFLVKSLLEWIETEDFSKLAGKYNR